MARDMQRYLRDGLGVTTFCAGCGHGILMGAILRAVDQLGLDQQKMLFVSGIGCAAWIPSPHFKADTLHTLHGRAVAYAVGAKVANPELEVMVISGDGDLSSIGGNHLIHAARRGHDLAVICANNEIYGMTGGQSASTTPLGARTTTSPQGNVYPPFDLVSLVRAAGAGYAARWPVSRPRRLIDSIKKAVECEGMGFVEAVSPCPTQFGRRNRHESIPALFEYVESLCITKEEAGELASEKTARYFVVGEWARD
jgi:2-oxoglutarate ferredoxin oxidoreductase subunit beta